MNLWAVELRADRFGWSVIVFPPEGAPKVVYHSPGEGAAGVYRAEGVVEFLASRLAATKEAYAVSTNEWEGR